VQKLTRFDRENRKASQKRNHSLLEANVRNAEVRKKQTDTNQAAKEKVNQKWKKNVNMWSNSSSICCGIGKNIKTNDLGSIEGLYPTAKNTARKNVRNWRFVKSEENIEQEYGAMTISYHTSDNNEAGGQTWLKISWRIFFQIIAVLFC
jgi:hypothetical protein